MFVIGTTEVQFIAYFQLIQYRLISLNTLISNCTRVHVPRVEDGNESTTSKSTILTPADEMTTSNGVTYVGLTAVSSISSYITTTALKQAVVKKRVLNSDFVDYNAFERMQSSLQQCITADIVKVQHIYMQLENVCTLINASYGIPIMFILVIKFTTLTALLYFCCMIIIKWVQTNILVLSYYINNIILLNSTEILIRVFC